MKVQGQSQSPAWVRNNIQKNEAQPAKAVEKEKPLVQKDRTNIQTYNAKARNDTGSPEFDKGRNIDETV